MHKPSNHVPNPDDGFEVSDVKVTWIVYAAIAGVLAVIGSIGVSFMYTKFLISEKRGYTYKNNSTHGGSNETDWTDPVHLQRTPEKDLKAYRAHSADRSASFGRVSESPEVYYIPVNEAINLVIDKGSLPTFDVAESAPVK